jgi:hypothetical protein
LAFIDGIKKGIGKKGSGWKAKQEMAVGKSSGRLEG